MSDIEAMTETHATPPAITNGLVEGQPLKRLDRTTKSRGAHVVPEHPDTVDHLALRRAATAALEQERAACLKRAAEITAEIGDEVEPQVGHPRARRSVLGLTPLDGIKGRIRAGTKNGAHAKKAARKPSGRLARRSLEAIDQVVDEVVALVKKSPDGLRAENIRDALKLEPRELPRVFRRALERKLLKAKGQKRATTYFARA